MEKSLDEIWVGVRKKTNASEKAAQKARVAAETARAKANTARDEAGEEIREMQRLILAGEDSTGNLLHDGIIALYGEYTTPSIVERYERISRELAEAPEGDLVVLIKRDIDLENCTGMGAKPRYGLVTTTAIGELGEDHEIMFDYGKRTASLFVQKYVHHTGRLRDVEVSGGNLVIDGAPTVLYSHEFSIGSDLGRQLDFRGRDVAMPLI